MLKFAGMILITAACSLWGISKSEALKLRSESLLHISDALTLLENEISYGQKNIKEAILSVGTMKNLALFMKVSEKIGMVSVREAFSDAILCSKTGLSESDNLILLEFAQNLGNLDKNSQIKSINMTKERLINAQSEAHEDYKKHGKLYRNIGFLLGILFSLILL